MKKYNNPNLEFISFRTQDIMSTSPINDLSDAVRGSWSTVLRDWGCLNDESNLNP